MLEVSDQANVPSCPYHLCLELTQLAQPPTHLLLVSVVIVQGLQLEIWKARKNSRLGLTIYHPFIILQSYGEYLLCAKHINRIFAQANMSIMLHSTYILWNSTQPQEKMKY